MGLTVWLATAMQAPGAEWVKEWLSIVLSAAAVMAVLYGYAKSLVRLNGYGGRLRKVEARVGELDELGRNFTRILERGNDERTHLRERVTKAQADLDDIRDRGEQLHGDLAGRISEWRMERNAEINAIRERLREVEVRIELLRAHDGE